MDNLKVQRRAHRAAADRMLERYPMSNSDLYSSDVSSDDDISDLIYQNLRFKSPMGPPRQINSFENNRAFVCPPQLRPRTQIACQRCNNNTIRTNPRFRPSSFHCYGQLRRPLVSDEDSSEDLPQPNHRSQYSDHRRRARLRCNSR